MRVELFGDALYGANVMQEQRMICKWTYNEIELQLWESRLADCTVLDLIVRSANTPTLRIALNNGLDVIRAEANQRNPNLLAVIRACNPDIEHLLDKQVAVEHQELVASTSHAATTKATQIRL